MKKFTILSCFLFLGFIAFAQNATNYVEKKEFQEKTKSLKSQVNLIKQTNSGLYKTVANIQTALDKQGGAIADTKTSIAHQTDSIESVKKMVSKVKHACFTKSNDSIVLALGLFILTICIMLSFRNACSKKLKGLINQMNETNSMLIEQGKSSDKKIAQLSIELNNAQDEIKKANEQIQLLSQKQEGKE